MAANDNGGNSGSNGSPGSDSMAAAAAKTGNTAKRRPVVSQQTSSSLMKQQHGRTQQPLRPVDEALLQAVEQSDLRMLRKCLAHKANVNASKEDKVSSLHIAAERGDVHVIRELLACPDLDADSRTAYGLTALYLAAQLGHDGVLVMLLKHGAKVDKGDQMGRTPLHAAVIRGHESSCAVLLRHEVDAKDGTATSGNTATGTSGGGTTVTGGADPDARDAFGDVPLYFAVVARPNPKIARLLLKNGADPNARGPDSMGVLLEAVLNSNQRNQVKIVEMLVQGGADIKSCDPIGHRTALHIAAMTGDVVMAERLIELGADVHARNSAGKTALDVARTHENYAVFSLLNSLS